MPFDVRGRMWNFFYLCQLIRLWHLSNRRPAKAQLSLRICAVSPEFSLFEHMTYMYGTWRKVRPNIRHVAPLNGCACCLKNKFTEDGKCHNLMRWLICDFVILCFRRWNITMHLHLSHVMRLWYVSSPVISFFNRACAANQVGLDVWCLNWPFIYFHTSCVRTAKALEGLRGCTDFFLREIKR